MQVKIHKSPKAANLRMRILILTRKSPSEGDSGRCEGSNINALKTNKFVVVDLPDINPCCSGIFIFFIEDISTEIMDY